MSSLSTACWFYLFTYFLIYWLFFVFLFSYFDFWFLIGFIYIFSYFLYAETCWLLCLSISGYKMFLMSISSSSFLFLFFVVVVGITSLVIGEVCDGAFTGLCSPHSYSSDCGNLQYIFFMLLQLLSPQRSWWFSIWFCVCSLYFSFPLYFFFLLLVLTYVDGRLQKLWIFLISSFSSRLKFTFSRPIGSMFWQRCTSIFFF